MTVGRYHPWRALKRCVAAALICNAFASTAQAECVILLHGLARTEASFALMQAALEAEGFDVIAPGYPSRRARVGALADEVIPPALAACGAQTTHFVTHSMGGILVREWLRDHALPQLGRVVMLAPPNQGSEVVDVLDDYQAFGWLNGPAGRQMGTGPDSLPRSLPAVQFPVGVIAGNQSLNAYFSTLLPGDDDGKVSVAATFVQGMRAHLTLPVTHTFMMNNPRVIAQTLHFLTEGRFDRDLTLQEVIWDRIDCAIRDAACAQGEPNVGR